MLFHGMVTKNLYILHEHFILQIIHMMTAYSCSFHYLVCMFAIRVQLAAMHQQESPALQLLYYKQFYRTPLISLYINKVYIMGVVKSPSTVSQLHVSTQF